MNSNSKKAGIVYLVGAGPGHPGLITRMGYELLHHCDAVAYDALIPLELVASLPERVERHYVGRRAGRHSMPQAEKNRLLLELAMRGLNVVRLKGGDTSFFGGSAEEAEYLAAAGVQVVVVPGVTAASAVAAASGLPLTDRRAASWAFFATGHGSADEPIPVPWKEIAALHGGTMVIYMGLANLEQTVEQILAGGHDGNTPCMVVQGAMTGVQQILDSRLSDVVADCRLKQIKPPALVIVGRVVQHRTPPSRCSTQLSGKRILVTCCAQETEAICAALRAQGAEPLPYPTYALEYFDEAENWARFSTAAASGGWCLFTSVMEVGSFVDAVLRNSRDLRILGNMKIAAFGSGTALALISRAIRPDIDFPASRRALSIQDLSDGKNLQPPVLVTLSNEIAIESKEWAEVVQLKLFRSKDASWERHWVQEITNNPPDFILFNHAAAVEGFMSVLGRDAVRGLISKCEFVSTSGTTAAAARRHGLPITLDYSDLFQLQLGAPASRRHE
jgi:uroporphyrinogen III methyltransferase / synthase